MSFECSLCPRECRVDRRSQMGFCLAPDAFLVARAAPHLWEEPILSGSRGSGTIFFSGCTMACCFCQNHTISRRRHGKILDENQLAEVMLLLQRQGCHNINLVTADHYLHRLPAVIRTARARGLTIPLALNTSSYVKVESLAKLQGLVDIYLPDLKYFSDDYAERFSSAPAYYAVATAAIAEMVRQCAVPRLSAEGIMQSGVIIRHMALPGLFFDSKKIMRYVRQTYGDQVYFSLMNQYTPMHEAARFPQLTRPLSVLEYDALLDYSDCLGFSLGFTQGEPDEDESFYIPLFDGTGLPEEAPWYCHDDN